MSWNFSRTAIYNFMPTLLLILLIPLLGIVANINIYAFPNDNSLKIKQIRNGKLINNQSIQDSMFIIRFGDQRENSNVYETRKTEYLIDSLGIVTLDNLLREDLLKQYSSFIQSKSQRVQNVGYTPVVWLRFKIQCETASFSLSHNVTIPRDRRVYSPLVLALGNRNADSVELYITQNQTVLYADTVGFSVPYRQWKIASTQVAFPLPDICSSGEVFTCYVRVRSSDIFTYYFLLTSKERFISNEYTFLQPFWLFYGIAVFALLYNLLIWISTRSIFYGIYIAYIFCICLSLAITSGHWYQLFSIDIPHLNTPLFTISWVMSMAFGVLFVTEVVRESKSSSLPRFWYWLAYIFWGCCALTFVFELMGLREYAVNIPYYSYLFIALPCTLGMSFFSWRQGYRPAFFLLVARVAVEIGLGINMAASLGYIEFSSILFSQLTLYVPAIEMIFMGLALADRITFLQKAKQDAETKALEGELYRIKNVELSQANDEITRQQKEILEQSRDIQEMNSQVTQLNLTLQEQNNQLAEINREKDEIMGMVVHDLKNPIGAVRGFAELISQGVLEEKQQVEEISSQILATSERMLVIVKNLLTINHLESGIFTINTINFSISNLIEGWLEHYQMSAEKKHINLHFAPDENAYNVCADESLVLQVFDNLISNAIKYSPPETNIYIRLSENQEKNYVRLEVQDEGPGISAEDMKKLFGKFARLSARPTGGEHSTGLGLSIVKKMAEVMNGRAWCESELGRGATFIVELPCSS